MRPFAGSLGRRQYDDVSGSRRFNPEGKDQRSNWHETAAGSVVTDWLVGLVGSRIRREPTFDLVNLFLIIFIHHIMVAATQQKQQKEKAEKIQ